MRGRQRVDAGDRHPGLPQDGSVLVELLVIVALIIWLGPAAAVAVTVGFEGFADAFTYAVLLIAIPAALGLWFRNTWITALTAGLPAGGAAYLWLSLAIDPGERYPTCWCFDEAVVGAWATIAAVTGILATLAFARQRPGAQWRQPVALALALAVAAATFLTAATLGHLFEPQYRF